MNIRRTKLTIAIFFVLAMIGSVALRGVVPDASAETLMPPVLVEDDAATIYKAKCAMCHTPKATKHFDLEKSDEHHVNAILKGMKGEKPPYMPEYETKGIDEAKAKALVAYMRQLREPATE